MASWDIFCCVVDNYGDIGVTWRLARQLAGEHGQQVRLWIDDLASFARLCPQADANLAQQWQAGVDVRRWPAVWEETPAADVVIEAFACPLPASYVEAMQTRAVAPLWLNLEYLSAEDWVTSCHGLPSMQPNGLQKYFYFPGFQNGAGGLLREAGLIERRQVFQRDTQQRQSFLGALGVSMQEGERVFSLFAYENPALGGWLDSLASAGQATLLLVPEGRVLGDVAAWFGLPGLAVGAQHSRGSLRVQVLPFVRQEDYDLLLWSCDFNAVRGEDSFVRALWAGRPFVWHIYEQEEGVHLEKLDAFLALYVLGQDEALRAPLVAFWHAWNGQGEPSAAWSALEKQLSSWSDWADRWSRECAAKTDLAAGLVRFYTNWL
ncbi:elongation factor P maturation arginine rhamnosyltransferase EarP [Pseudomonas knackmussii]|uniref:elongation factor P maturation arginine rhamnosyltransferase EarP n=1 Tax=Pseudomonas knackmussii TaxID=65741 RepID=UPI00136448CC|nr:elongation factor P maturation arginine rhamnosyltransferase EarP [Pseudomonas knackmussii]